MDLRGENSGGVITLIEEVEEEQEEAMSIPEAVASALKGKLIGEQSPEDANETPLPGETLAMFYHRTRTWLVLPPVSGR